MAFSHHNAAHGNEWCGGEAELLSTQQAGKSDVAAGTELAVSLDDYTTTKVVEHQSLVSLCETQLPR